MRTYTPLLAEMQVYIVEGWQVEIFPWVVGVCGLRCNQVLSGIPRNTAEVQEVDH